MITTDHLEEKFHYCNILKCTFESYDVLLIVESLKVKVHKLNYD